MQSPEKRRIIRAAVRTYEAALPTEQRKKLGQFFTGIPLGKLLAHLSISAGTRTILDPMAGHGDLLDATWETADECGVKLKHIDGIEIDKKTASLCGKRLAQIINSKLPTQKIVAASAFDLDSFSNLQQEGYDLVITNPPYVRYQSQEKNGANKDVVRKGLTDIIAKHLSGVDKDIWTSLVENYSGLADLSIPAWLLAAALVRPGGRLALVIPATWRSRNYADVIRYLLLRCFSLEYIVEDKQPGWFSDAQVRTHLIIARRLPADESAVPVRLRTKLPKPLWLHIAPKAASGDSLVGAIFDGPNPEKKFSAWVRSGCSSSKDSVHVDNFDLNDEWATLKNQIDKKTWYKDLEKISDKLPKADKVSQSSGVNIPHALRDLLPRAVPLNALSTLEGVGIQVGQGLRTGCNKFFYVTAYAATGREMLSVETSSFLGSKKISIPVTAVRPVLRKQCELTHFKDGQPLCGRVLDLKNWILPEDFEIVSRARSSYIASGEKIPQVMPKELAEYVRIAAKTSFEDKEKRIPQLSAVCTNIRISRNNQVTPRFWYMLPDFTPRHIPDAFVPRVNHGMAWVENNIASTVIDANFSTFCSTQENWTPHALKAFLNSVWCRSLMESLGTPLGGGALKLEATHLRRMPVPVLSSNKKLELDHLGKQLTKNTAHIQNRIDTIILDALLSSRPSQKLAPQKLAVSIIDWANNMSHARQRVA